MNKQDFINFLVNYSKSSPSQWINQSFEVNGKVISLKAFGKWVQVIKIPSQIHHNGYITDSIPEQKTYKAYKQALEKVLETVWQTTN